MTLLDKEVIKYLTVLSRIDCSEKEQMALLEDLRAILEYVSSLQAVETSGVEEFFQEPGGTINVMREDVVGETLPRDLFLVNAPSQTSGLVRVPPVIKQT